MRRTCSTTTTRLVPVRDLGLRAAKDGNAVRLTWNGQHVSPARTFYTVLRTNHRRVA